MALGVFLARQRATRAEIRETITQLFGYDLDRTVEGIRSHYSFDVSCQGSVPEAIVAFLEIPPKFAGQPPVNPESRKDKGFIEREWRGAQGLAEDLRYYGKWMRGEAEKRIGHPYPKIQVTAEMAQERPDLKPLVGQKLTVIAWLWARTVKSPNPEP